MMIEFPKFIFIDDSSINISIQTNVIEDEMSDGLKKRRIKSSKNYIVYSFDVSFHNENFEEFKRWFRHDINSGTRNFRFKDPLDGSFKVCRFVSTDLSFSKKSNLIVSSFEIEGFDE